MKLPGGERAWIDPEKLAGYCLNPSHPRGRHKARVFESALGLVSTDADVLRAWLLRAALTDDAVSAESDEYGARYILDFPCVHLGRWAMVRSGWIVLHSEDFPRLTTCFVL